MQVDFGAGNQPPITFSPFAHWANSSFLCVLLLFTSSLASADDSGFAAMLALSAPKGGDSRYEDPGAPLATLSYASGRFRYSIGYDTYEFTHKDTRVDAYIEQRGVHLGVGYVINGDRVNLELGGGLVLQNRRVYYNQQELLDENEVAPFVEAKASLPLDSDFAGVIGLKVIEDDDINTILQPFLGLQYTF